MDNATDKGKMIMYEKAPLPGIKLIINFVYIKRNAKKIRMVEKVNNENIRNNILKVFKVSVIELVLQYCVRTINPMYIITIAQLYTVNSKAALFGSDNEIRYNKKINSTINPAIEKFLNTLRDLLVNASINKAIGIINTINASG